MEIQQNPLSREGEFLPGNKALLKMLFLFLKVGYASSLEGNKKQDVEIDTVKLTSDIAITSQIGAMGFESLEISMPPIPAKWRFSLWFEIEVPYTKTHDSSHLFPPAPIFTPFC